MNEASAKSILSIPSWPPRGSRLSPDHVNALNRIELDFYGSIFLGRRFQTSAEKAVTAAWNEYLDSLTVNFVGENWQAREELFVNLMSSMAKCLRLEFDRVHLKRNVYSPLGHFEVEQELHKIRKAVLEIVEGRKNLKVEPTLPSAQPTLPHS